MLRFTSKSTTITRAHSDPATPKKLLSVSLVAVALSLGACTQEAEESSVHEFDFQTSEEEAAAEVAASNAPMIVDREDNPVVPSRDEPADTGAVAATAGTVDDELASTDINNMTTDSAEAVDTDQ